MSDAVNALVVQQWLSAWDDVHFDAKRHQARPLPYFLMFTMPAAKLRVLAATYRRDASSGAPRSQDTSIQRSHDSSRSAEIQRFVQHGYPWSDLSSTRRGTEDARDLYKPGWLPTAVVINILRAGDKRQGRSLAERDALGVNVPQKLSGAAATITMPESWTQSEPWAPDGVAPVEVIDGQHRLWAFENSADDPDYSLPVIAFYDLDISWQAYLFWTINIKPKRINASLAFDLYPLLREQEWLDAGEGLRVYRDTRSQELAEALWAVQSSPWYHRINMLGDGRRADQPVTQSAFVKSITDSFVKHWHVGPRIGGLFGNNKDDEGLSWNRSQQAAFLILAWRFLADAVRETSATWAVHLRELDNEEHTDFGVNPPFQSKYSLLASDQGIRPFLLLMNNLCVANAHRLRLHEWKFDEVGDDLDPDIVEYALLDAENQPFAEMLSNLCSVLASYDWRTARTPNLSAADRDEKLALRGSGGYTVLRERLEKHVRERGNRVTAEAMSHLDRL